MRVSASIIPRRSDEQAESDYRVNSTAEAKVNCHAICAASIQPEDRDGEFPCVGIKITSRFQIRSRISHANRPCGRPGFRRNHELCEVESGWIVNIDLDETDERRWTVEHASREIVQLWSRGRDAPLSCCATERCQHEKSRQHGNPLDVPIRLVLHCSCDFVIASLVCCHRSFAVFHCSKQRKIPNARRTWHSCESFVRLNRQRIG